MEKSLHTVTELFAQLGLPNDPAAIAGFISQHAPLKSATALADASFWNPSQAAFLREQEARDADWAEVVDQLNLALRRANDVAQIRVLFLCDGNADLSQMAEGLLHKMGGDNFAAHSAGLVPLPLENAAVQVMREIGIDISRHTSKGLADFAEVRFDYVITLCDEVRSNCIDFPRDGHTLHWHFEHPRIAGEDRDQHLARFRVLRDGMAEKLSHWIRGLPTT